MDAFRINDEDEDFSNQSCLVRMNLNEWTALDKPSLAKQFPIFKVDDDRPIDAIIRPPNVDEKDPQSVLKVANGGITQPCCARQVVWGWLVSVGEVMTVWHNGAVRLVGPGRHSIKLWSKLFAKWGQKFQLTENMFTDGPLTFVRVSRGQIGLAVENGRPVFLQEGTHVYNNPVFRFIEFKPVNAEHIRHMSYHVVRVPKGFFGKIMEQNRAKLLPEGTHTFDNAVFEYLGLVSSAEPYITCGSVHIFQVPKGHLGLVYESCLPLLLHEGVHIYDSPTFKVERVVNKMEPQIVHGTISRFRVQKGQVGLAWNNNNPELIEEPGTYQVDSSNFRFVKLNSTSDKKIVLGAKKTITVYTGEVGVTFKRGELQILDPGSWKINDAEHIFDDFLSTQQLSLRLQPERGSDLLICETKDLVNIGIRADVFYSIKDPLKALKKVGREAITELVRDTSIATLNNIIRSTALGDIAQSSDTSAVSMKTHTDAQQAAQATGDPSAPLFFDKAHDAFIAKLHDDFLENYGLEIKNIRIEQFKIMDESLARSIAGQAVKTAETQSELANLEGQNKIAVQQQERDARMRTIKAQADAQTRQVQADSERAQAEAIASAQKVRIDMEANTTRTQATAQADAIRLAATAEKDAVEIKASAVVKQAEAEAQAIRLKAQAEAERAKLLAAVPLGEKLALLDVYAEVVKKSNEGVEKVVYVDPTTTQAGNPLSLLTLQSLQKDLATLDSSNKSM
eukprot:TRINITY_DN24242_c0_g2_i2.p1 TRINITY_DN24242_c0_g2~~TRINITY_DN24242_c0_g2_i2.p1  ORF type:complete len:736 (+),score=154.64 TRINITY_DN24242_c0_g2_i2:63-2270(+)